MNVAEKLQPTEQLLTLTREMLRSAQAGDWEKLVELEKTRLPLLDQVFAHGIAANVGIARELLSIDEQTKSLAIAEMPVVQDELLKMQNSNKASTAYQAIQGFTSNNK